VRPVALLVAAAMTLLVTQAHAHASIVVGQWTCQTSYTELDQSGNRTSGYVQEFAMTVAPEGALSVGGTTLGAAGAVQFQGTGSWTLEKTFFNGKATIQDNSSFGSIPLDLYVLGTLEGSALRISSSNETRDPTGTYVAVRMHSVCERPGL
jgi:hypothetical protein